MAPLDPIPATWISIELSFVYFARNKICVHYIELDGRSVVVLFGYLDLE